MLHRPADGRRRAGGLAPRLGLLLISACTGVGPASVPRDRSEYSAAIGESWKRQALLNVVKLRYLDVPIFLDVGQIVSGYTLQNSVGLGASIDLGSDGNFADVGAASSFTDRPTITYTPLTGDRFLRGLVHPLPAGAIVHMLQAGYAADVALTWCVDAFNGLRNRSAVAGSARPAEPDFLRAVELMRDIQQEHGFSLSIRPGADQAATVLVFHGERLPEPLRAKTEELRVLLGLPADRHEYMVVASTGRGGPGELAIQPRSLLQILMAMSGDVEVPPDHLADGRALPVATGDLASTALSIRSTLDEPQDAFVAVSYRGRWFWIDDRDWRSKRTFGLMMFLFALAESADTKDLPVLTIPTG